VADTVRGLQQFGLAMINPQYAVPELLRAGINTGLAADALVAVDQRM